MSTIKHKSVDEVMQELLAEFPAAIQEPSCNDYKDRLNHVLGIHHFNEEYDGVEIKTIVTSKGCVNVAKVCCRIEILDDNFMCCLAKNAIGTFNVPASEIIEDASEIIQSACKDAFIRVCRDQLCIGVKQLPGYDPGTISFGTEKLCEFKSTTVLKELEKFKGSFVIKAKNSEGEKVIYFLSDTIKNLNPATWSKWHNNLSKRNNLCFSCYITEADGKTIFTNFG